MQRATRFWAAIVGLGLLAAPSVLADEVLDPGRPLDRNRVERMVREALAARGFTEPLTLRIERPDLPLANRAAGPIALSIVSLDHDPRTGRYEAYIQATLESGVGSRIAVAGTAVELIEIVVPRRAIAQGETITPRDLVMRHVTMAELRPDAALVAEDLVGQEAARPLPAGRALRTRDVTSPPLVRRGEPVRIVYAAAGLEIITAGVALGQGRVGEIVQVQNAASGEIRRGTVGGPRRVLVDSLGARP
jgi:flagella basal body P-ring formation protein FlgA